LEKQSASIREFARIIGVDHAAVSRAVKGGDRLRNSVICEGGKKRIVIYDGCLEWHHNKDHRKDRRRDQPAPSVAASNPGIISSDLDSHYSALSSRLSTAGSSVSSCPWPNSSRRRLNAFVPAGIPFSTCRSPFQKSPKVSW
jgi:hypothetical protein